MTTATEASFSLDEAYAAIDRHLEAIGRLRVAIAENIAEHNRHAAEVVTAGDVCFTPAESRVARLMATPMTAPEMATALHLSVNTVKTHMKSIYRKLQTESRRDAKQALKALGRNRCSEEKSNG